jgi:hypothetical protein
MDSLSRKPALFVLKSLTLAFLVSGFLTAEDKPRLPIGEFTATRIKAPTIDGKIGQGEWDRAFTTSGMIAPFDHTLHQVETTVSMGFDDRNFYFLLNCQRGDQEWRLQKSCRENDAYNFGDPSIEIWVTPPTLVAETYQNILNTYPAVLDQKMIPSRGYVAQGWSGNWKVGVTESDTHYIIEAAVPIKDFGFETVKNGDIWRFLLCRTCPGAKPRAQASWSVTQGFSEIPQHPQVHLMDNEVAFQLLSIISVFTGKYEFPMAVVAPEKAAADVEVELRFRKDVLPGENDRIEKQAVSLEPGERKELRFVGDVTDMKSGYFTISARKKGGTEIFRQHFPFEVNGFKPQAPVRPADAKIEELALRPLYGPETNTLLLVADIIDLPAREQAASATMKIIDPASNRVLKQAPMPRFVNWYSSTNLVLDGIQVPVLDCGQVDQARKENAALQLKNVEKINAGQAPLPLKPLPTVEPLKLLVEVAVCDKDGKELKKQSQEVGLRRYRFPWQNNDVGVTDEVIPPWTPVTWESGAVGVWNRSLKLTGLGLAERIDNGGASQIRSMRLVAVSGGKEVPIRQSTPSLSRLVNAAATLTGTGDGAGLSLSATTRVEFDGFVLSQLTVGPAANGQPTKVEKLFLEVVLPESEATHFCSTAGGWAAVHDVTPPYWSSLQTASGMLIGDFVPYIWLTNSDRAFLWFADSDKGWVTDEQKALPTQELIRKDGTVTLRVHFIEVPCDLTQPRTMTYGYQVFPSRPLPPGWRAVICNQQKDRLPSARNTYFWADADWAVLWPYYCSPYPWSMEKSRTFYANLPVTTDHRPCVGSIAHSIGRYRDYEGNNFNEYAVDWGSTPGNTGDANVTACKGTVDFRLYHYQRWVREAGFRGLYIDENYLGLEDNFLTGGAYLRPDNRLQRGYSYLGLREYFKRMMIMFHQNRVPRPNLWMHISSGSAYHAWFGDVYFEGENVEPTDLNYDYIEVLPAGRMRSIGSAACSGGVMTMMCQSQRHATIHEPKHTHQFVGWVMAHDILPEQVGFYEILAQEGRLYEDNVQFIGYWHAKSPFKTKTPDCVVSAHKAGHRALLWVVNTAREERNAEVSVDFKALGYDRAKVVAMNAETGQAVELKGNGFAVPVLRRDFVAVHLIERRLLKGPESLYASFDAGREADESLGCCVFQRPGGQPLGQTALVEGVKGKALAVGTGIQFWPRLHVTDEEGRISFQALLAPEAPGDVLRAGNLRVFVKIAKESQIVLERLPGKEDAQRGEQVAGKHPGAGWHAFDLSWNQGKAVLKVDGAEVGQVVVSGFGIGNGTGVALTKSARFVLGGGQAFQAIDELRCYRTP